VEKASIPVFDCHHSAHGAEHSIAPRSVAPLAATEEERERAVETVVESHVALMDRDHIGWAAIHANFVYRRANGLTDTQAVNDWTAAYRDRQPERFPAVFGVVEPLYCEEGLPEIDRCLQQLGMTGIGFHPRFQGVSTENYWILRFVERILDLGGVPVLRAMGETPEEMLWKVAKVARAFPDAEILVLDMFATWEGLAEAQGVAEECPNLLWSTSLAYDWDMIEPFAHLVGFDRILFGSDIKVPFIGTEQVLFGNRKGKPIVAGPDRFFRPGVMTAPRRTSHLLAQLLTSSITPEEKRLVTYDNAARLFNLDQPTAEPTGA
jgi:predicted TIM-barrel fold metal-dependent hydrolase